MSNKEKSIADEFIKKVGCAIRCIESSMKRNRLNILHIGAALDTIEKRMVVQTVLKMKAEGFTNRKIARTIHIDDKKVSAIVKDNATKPCCAKPCKPCKPGKPCKPCKPCKK